MPGLPLIVPDVVQVSIEMQCSGRTVMNVLGFENTADTPMATLLATVKSAWEYADGPLKRRSNQLTMVGYHGIDLSAVDAPVGYLGSGTSGALAGDIATMGACAVIKLSSGTRGRSKQGRVFHGPLVESQVNTDGRTLTGSQVTELTASYQGFLSQMDIAGNPWCVISRAHFNHSNIVSSAAEGIIGTQRRRIR